MCENEFNMNNEKETISIQVPESFGFGDFGVNDFDKVLSFFDWSLEEKRIEVDYQNTNLIDPAIFLLHMLFFSYASLKHCEVFIDGEHLEAFSEHTTDWQKLRELKNDELHGQFGIFVVIKNSDDKERALEFGEKYTKTLDLEYDKTLRYVLNELLYNTLEHGGNENNIPSLLEFFWNNESNELSFIVADVGIGIRRHLRQTYPNLSTDSEAILHSIKPQISGTFGRPNTGYETKNNAGVGLFFSSNIAQRLNADMYIVSGNGFVHISPTEIISKELVNEWKGTFVYVKMKLGLIEDLNFQKMLAEITKSIPKSVEVTEDNNLYISVRNYFGKYAEDKDLAKKLRDEKLLIALLENKSLQSGQLYKYGVSEFISFLSVYTPQ